MYKVALGITCLLFVVFAPVWLTACLLITTLSQFHKSKRVEEPEDRRSDISDTRKVNKLLKKVMLGSESLNIS